DIDGHQPNDPDKAADALIAISQSENPPVHLFLGSDAYDIVYKKIDILTNDVEQWKNYTLSTAL
ncbi:MAG TPA: short-chain dehydrogenase/reductase, partial [Sphingobacterium sp.]|nr:short-chain dehydrogenase/reductase [Sphingobacterium sp.]